MSPVNHDVYAVDVAPAVYPLSIEQSSTYRFPASRRRRPNIVASRKDSRHIFFHEWEPPRRAAAEGAGTPCSGQSAVEKIREGLQK